MARGKVIVLEQHPPDGVFLGNRKYVDGTGQILHRVHRKADCRGPYCPIHNPSEHSMRSFPTHFRFDRYLMERICPHGVGHPDPDDPRSEEDGVHGCDGCCGTILVYDPDLEELCGG